jgi:two-component system sensor histidine kinase HydH
LSIATDIRDGKAVVLEVRDTGTGIALNVLDRIFEPFVSTKETGVGLGLVLSQRIAEDHGGCLKAENVTGGGARFILDLPLARVAEPSKIG